MSTIKVNTITKRSGSTLTIGECGATVQLATGATQTGFGRTGTVDWCTTAKTSPFTAVSGKGYFVNTTSGAVTVTLPASPSAGDIVAVSDYASTANTNNITVARNGSLINAAAGDARLNTIGISTTFVYVDGTRGWKQVNDATSNISGNPGFVVATGGTVTTCGDYKIHTFTSDGCFAVTNTFGSGVGSNVSYVVVAGGGAGGSSINYNCGAAAAGGAGGYREGKFSSDPYSASPLAATPCSGLPVSVQTYPITVGAGAAAVVSDTAGPPPDAAPGARGSNSVFSTITSTGGGGGAAGPGPNGSSQFPGRNAQCRPGGSGGGANYEAPHGNAIGTGNTPPVSPSQGNPGGTAGIGPPYAGGGGGGATAAGTNFCGNQAGPGGAGATSSITGSPVVRAGGGGASGSGSVTKGTGGPGGGGAGGDPSCLAVDGTANTGGGGGGANTNPHPAPNTTSGAGGSGVVIIRYKFQ